jgi:hypothetical protein
MFSSSVNVQACIEDVPVKDRGPIRMLCDMTLENTSCLHVYIEGEYSTEISSTQMIDNEAYLRIKGLDQYTTIINKAVDAWNVQNIVHLELNDNVYDVEFLIENLGYNGVLARYIYTGDMNFIVLNAYYFDSLSGKDQISVLTHELGHALGLDDTLNEDSIMWQGLSEGKEIGDVDIRNLQAVIEELRND